MNTTSHTFSYAMSGTPSASASGTALLVTTGGTLDGSISRVSALMDHQGTSAGIHLEEYTYLGLDTIVTMNRPEANEKLTYKQVTGDTLHGSDGGDQYTGLDRFGRVVDQYWLNTASSPNAIDRFQYGYDRDGDVLYKKNLLSSSFSELYHTNSASSGDNNSAYDLLGRLTGMRRGTLSSSGHNGSGLDTVTTLNSTSGITGNSKSWSLNAVGDWSSVTTDGTAATHTTNAQNEITAVGATSQTYDNNGNVLTDSVGNTLTYDAWNRLMSSTGQSLKMQYDALGRWTHEVLVSGTNSFYYDTMGQNVETLSLGGVFVQNVWGMGYTNEIVLRDKNSDSSSTGNYGLTGSALEQRLYANQDANWNVTTLYQVNGTAGVAERIIYDAYGAPTTLTAAWANFSTQTFFFRFLFQGTYWLQEANVQMMGARDMDYTTGSWVQKDPSGYPGGMDDYEALNGNPISSVDPTGLYTTEYNHSGDSLMHPPIITVEYVDKDFRESPWLDGDGGTGLQDALTFLVNRVTSGIKGPNGTGDIANTIISHYCGSQYQVRGKVAFEHIWRGIIYVKTHINPFWKGPEHEIKFDVQESTDKIVVFAVEQRTRVVSCGKVIHTSGWTPVPLSASAPPKSSDFTAPNGWSGPLPDTSRSWRPLNVPVSDAPDPDGYRINPP